MTKFKKCKVIMLPTGDITGIVLHSTRLDKIVHTKESELKAVLDIGGVSQHLYITSDEKIEEGWKGWAYKDDVKGKIFKHFYTTNPWYKDARKIVATTDKSLLKDFRGYEYGTAREYSAKVYLPQIPQSFIRKYVEAGGKIDEIDILNENFEIGLNNYIIIKPIKVSWTREEVEELCRTALHTRFPGNMCMQEDADRWIANYIK